METFYERAKCTCENIDERDFRLLFDPITAYLNNFQSSPLEGDSCLQEEFPRTLRYLDFIKLDLPETCSIQTWEQEGRCTLQFVLDKIDTRIQVSFFQQLIFLPDSRVS